MLPSLLALVSSVLVPLGPLLVLLPPLALVLLPLEPLLVALLSPLALVPLVPMPLWSCASPRSLGGACAVADRARRVLHIQGCFEQLRVTKFFLVLQCNGAPDWREVCCCVSLCVW